MNLSQWTTVLSVSLVLSCANAQVREEFSPSEFGYQATERGPHHTRWRKIAWETNDVGEVRLTTNAFTQVASGLNRWRGTEWDEASPELILTNGGVLARGGQATAFFRSNINARAATSVLMPGGQRLTTHLIGLAYHDRISGTNLLLAAPKDSAPQIISSNEVVYPDAFDSVRCDVRYTYGPAGVRQDVILRERLPRPEEDCGLSSSNVHLLVISEVDEGPLPRIVERSWHAGNEILTDQTLTFGEMAMVPGRAFRLNEARQRRDIRVAKQFETIGNRHFVVERVRYERVKPELQSLPPLEYSLQTHRVELMLPF